MKTFETRVHMNHTIRIIGNNIFSFIIKCLFIVECERETWLLNIISIIFYLIKHLFLKTIDSLRGP